MGVGVRGEATQGGDSESGKGQSEERQAGGESNRKETRRRKEQHEMVDAPRGRLTWARWGLSWSKKPSGRRRLQTGGCV